MFRLWLEYVNILLTLYAAISWCIVPYFWITCAVALLCTYTCCVMYISACTICSSVC